MSDRHGNLTKWIESRLGILTIRCRCKMCGFHHKIHWSVVSVVVNIFAVCLFCTGVATPNWARKTVNGYSINTGLFQACVQLNDTCYDTHMYFDGYSQKSWLIGSAIVNVFALIGFFLFFTLALFFLCGLFEEKQLATLAVVLAYFSGILAIAGTVMYSAAIKSLNYDLSWSFILAVLGFCLNFSAGVLMCVGRNVSTKKRKKKRKPPTVTSPGIEDVEMADADTTHKKVWDESSAMP